MGLFENIIESIAEIDAEHGIDPYSSQEDIAALQKSLIFLGYSLPQYGPDGDYGGETINAVEQFQTDNGIDITGIADAATLQNLRDAFDGITVDVSLVEQQIRAEIIMQADSYIGTEEQGADNHSPAIAEFLRSDEYSPTQGNSSSAPIGSSWCAGFASHILHRVTPDIADYNVLAKGIMQEFDAQGAFYDLDSDYIPQPGDMIFFERGVDGDWRGHVGFVSEVRDDGAIVTIEGNRGNPDFDDDDSEIWSADRPDGVHSYIYSPEEFEEMRILGFGNVMEQYALNVGLENVIGVPAQSPPTPAPEPLVVTTFDF